MGWGWVAKHCPNPAHLQNGLGWVDPKMSDDLRKPKPILGKMGLAWFWGCPIFVFGNSWQLKGKPLYMPFHNQQ
jgi:hypothetical protein